MKFPQFVAIGLILVSYSGGDGCAIRLYRELRRCDALWGHDAEVAVGPQGGNAYNISQLIRYCRNPSGERVGDCMTDAYAQCDPGWGEEERPVFQSQAYFLARGIEYLCSEVDVIERDRSCINGVATELTECERASVREFDESFQELQQHDPVPWSENRRLLERMGRYREQCVKDLFSEQCNLHLGQVFGNFLYGVGVHAFDNRNRNLR
ncbi:uncharacterized protein LOC135475936 [Liolophura sinensis]|uniref:uncharacterized protein LOC135475936 n=1 Tax=Liolophura sinensis TaxID=3198878 RepID=UPI003158D20F